MKILHATLIHTIFIMTLNGMHISQEEEIQPIHSFYSIILPGQNGLGGENFSRDHIINTPFRCYTTLQDKTIDLGQQHCIEHFSQQLKEDPQASRSKLLLYGVSQGTATMINWLAQLPQEEQEKIRCLTLEAVLGSGNSAILHTAKSVRTFTAQSNNTSLRLLGSAAEKVTQLPLAHRWLPWLVKPFTYPTYQPNGLQAFSSAPHLSSKIPVIIMHCIHDPQLSIEDARQLYTIFRKNGNDTYLFEVNAHPHAAHINILTWDREKEKKQTAIQAIYKKHNLPYHQMPDIEDVDLKEFQPDIENFPL
jgi:hypothetical protein